MASGWIGLQHSLRRSFDITINQSELEDACSEVADLIEENINMVRNKRNFKEAVNRIVYEQSYEYVPYKTGKLSGSSDGMIGIDKYVSITGNGIHYKMPYAGYQYYQANYHSRLIHPLATDHWIEAAFDDKAGLIMYEIEEVLEANLKKQFRS